MPPFTSLLQSASIQAKSFIPINNSPNHYLLRLKLLTQIFSLVPLEITLSSILKGARLIKISKAFKLQQPLPLMRFALQQYYKGFFLDPQAPSIPLFTAFSGAAFSTLYTQKMLKLRLNLYNILAIQYTSYSFYRGAA